MMLIKQAQMVKLGEPALQRFITDTVLFAREECTVFAQGKSDDELREVVVQFIDIGTHYNIVIERNVQRLLYYTLQNKLTIPYPPHLEEALRLEGWDENYRIKQFIKRIRIHGNQGI
jgi:hypothetical protein